MELDSVYWSFPLQVRARPLGRGPLLLHGKLHSRARDRRQFNIIMMSEMISIRFGLTAICNTHVDIFQPGWKTSTPRRNVRWNISAANYGCRRGECLLDIGCGWGGLARYAASKYGVDVLGVTLSKNQKDYADEQTARAGLQERVAVELKDYRDLGDESFDKVVSVGMFEHVGRSHLPEYFAQVHRLLKPGGLFLNHGISRRAIAQEGKPGLIQNRIFGRGTFQQKYIFPDGELTPVSEVNVMAEDTGFEVRDVENLREHYALTLRNWVNRLADHREEAIKVSNEVTYRTWRLYMSASVYGFESGNINVNQNSTCKDDAFRQKQCALQPRGYL